MNGVKYNGYINLIGNLRNDYKNKKARESSLIGISQDSKYIYFGKISKKYLLSYREDEFKKQYFQNILDGSDICMYKQSYNIRYIFSCNNQLKKGNPNIIININICNIIVDIYAKEACNYEKLIFDLYLNEFKIIICIFYSIFFVVLLIPRINTISFIVTNSFSFVVILSLILFSFIETKDYLILILVFQIIILIIIIIITIFLNPKNDKIQVVIKYIYYFILCSISGFFFGEEIIEIIYIYYDNLNNWLRWLIICLFTIIFNLFLFIDKWKKNSAYVICSSLLQSYFISNIVSIANSKKIPINTIINSLEKEGFEHSFMKEFIYPKYYIYFIIYIIIFIIVLIFKCVLLYYEVDKNIFEKIGIKEDKKSYLLEPIN